MNFEVMKVENRRNRVAIYRKNCGLCTIKHLSNRFENKLASRSKKDVSPIVKTFYFCRPLLTHGVTGNTSGFGPEESRFEP